MDRCINLFDSSSVYYALKPLILFSERSKKLIAKVIILKSYFIKSPLQLVQKRNEIRKNYEISFTPFALKQSVIEAKE